MVRVAIAILVSVLMASAAHAKRVALVVGINKYDNLPRDRQLAKAVNDARAMEAALKAVGFDVIKAEDVGRPAFNQAWQQLLNKLAPGDEVAVFFSGHGVEIEGVNYLIPRDVPAVASGETRRLKNESLSFDEIRRDLAAHGPKLSLFILDACRDNPFTDTRGRSIGGSKGLVPVQAEQGSFIMFAAGAREMALDRLSDTDADPNSIYTRKLLPLLKQPGLRLPDVAQRVRGEVRQLANTVGHRQSPAYYDEGADDVCLAGCAKPQHAAAPEVSEATREWPRVDKASIAELETFVRRHGSSPEADYARARIDRLKQQVAIATPPAAKPVDPPLQKGPSNRDSETNFSILENTEITGKTRTFGGQQKNADECAGRCLTERSCQAFSFDKRYQHCFLIGEVTSRRNDPSFMSGTVASRPQIAGSGQAKPNDAQSPSWQYARFTILENIEAIGETRTYAGTLDADGCATKCLTEKACRAFSYDKSSRFCYLLDRVISTRADSTFLSGRLR